MEWPTPVSGVPFIELTVCKYDLNSVFHFRGKEDHTIVYQGIGGTHKVHEEVEAKIPGCLIGGVGFEPPEPPFRKKCNSYTQAFMLPVGQNKLAKFPLQEATRAEGKKNIRIQPETLNQPHFINHWHLIADKIQCSYQVWCYRKLLMDSD